MALFLNVPYAEKEEAKALGARWDPMRRKWYLTDRRQYARCAKWIEGNTVVCGCIYIVEGKRTCFRCGRPTQVIGFGFETFYVIDDEDAELWQGDIHIGNIMSPLPPQLSGELKKRYNYFWGFSQTTQSSAYSNHCQNPQCGILQGNHYLFGEADSPFFIEGAESAGRLTLYRIPLIHDIAVDAEIGWGSEDHCIGQYARRAESDLQWR